jgi:hypothetical protein
MTITMRLYWLWRFVFFFIYSSVGLFAGVCALRPIAAEGEGRFNALASVFIVYIVVAIISTIIMLWNAITLKKFFQNLVILIFMNFVFFLVGYLYNIYSWWPSLRAYWCVQFP